MPRETPPNGTDRWEGTHLYNRTEGRKRPRTVAQIREEAVTRAKEDREKRRIELDKRRKIQTGGSPKLNNAESSYEKRSSGAEVERSEETNTEGGGAAPGNSETDREDQENENNMPGSNKKKRHASKGAEPSGGNTDPGANIDPFLRDFLLTIKNDINKSTDESVGKLTARIDKNEETIKEMRQDMERRDAEMDSRIAEKIDEALKKTATVAPASGSSQRRERAYHFSRRSLKMWPIAGDDVMDEVRIFLNTKLGIADGRIEAMGKIQTSMIPGQAAKARKEVLVTFESKEDRDFVKSSGSNLAQHKDCGITLHVPGHLMDNLLALNSVGYAIKSKHKGVKRSVKFDDDAQNLFLDICIAGKWKRITPDEARTAMKNLPETNDSRSLSADDLANLVQGEPVAGLTVVTIGEDEETMNQ